MHLENFMKIIRKFLTKALDGGNYEKDKYL